MQKYLPLSFVFLLFTYFANAQYKGILVDGLFNDWPAEAIRFNDPKNDAQLADIEHLSVWNDSLNLYLRLKLGKELNLQETPINIYIDTDNNPATGLSFQGLGIDFSYFFGSRRGIFQGKTVFHNHVGHISAPTHTSNEFEIVFSRHAIPDNINKLFPGNTIKFILREEVELGDVIPDNGAITYTFNSNPQPVYTPVEITREDTSLLRLMSYNVLRDRPMSSLFQIRFQRIIKTIQPDIIAFNEFYNSSANEVKQLMDNTLPLGNTDGWYAVKQGLDLVTLSKYPVKQSWQVLPGHNISATLIDLPAHFAKDLLVINAHFRCCAGGSQARQQEADAVIAFIRDARTPGGNIDLPKNTPFILMGDLNLVTQKQQLLTLLNGDIQDSVNFGKSFKPDWDTTDLADLISYHSDAPMSYTWYDDRSDFAPGRLDYMIYSNSVMQPEKAFTLETANMSPARLKKYELLADDARISDHLPKAADFRLEKKITIGLQEKSSTGNIKVYPNPVLQNLYINLPENTSSAQIKITDAAGRTMRTLHSKNTEITLQTGDLKPGLYFIQIITGDNIYSRKIVKE